MLAKSYYYVTISIQVKVHSRLLFAVLKRINDQMVLMTPTTYQIKKKKIELRCFRLVNVSYEFKYDFSHIKFDI